MQFSLSSIPKTKVIFAATMLAVFFGVGIANYLAKEIPKPPVLLLVNTLTLAGRGDLDPLHMVMLHDNSLREMVAELGKVSPVDIFAKESQVDMKVADILFRWAEADMAEKGAYGPYIDARVASFLRKIGSVPASFMPGTEIPIKDATNLTQLWFKVFDHYRIRLLAQTAGQKIFDGKIVYNMNTNALSIGGPISPAFVAAFQEELQTAKNSGEQMRAFLDFIDGTKGFSTLSEKEQDMIMGIEVKTAPEAAHADFPAALPDLTSHTTIPGQDKLPAVNAIP